QAPLLHSHAAFLRGVNRAIEFAQLPPELQGPESGLMPEPPGREAPLAQLFWPALPKMTEASRRSQAELHCAVVAVALERYRRDHGRWPESLARLAPHYLRSMPSDPYDGQPLRYRRLDDGVVVYSVGPDGEDDGGTIDREKPPTEPGTDIG